MRTQSYISGFALASFSSSSSSICPLCLNCLLKHGLASTILVTYLFVLIVFISSLDPNR
jgi:hypothetical protein